MSDTIFTAVHNTYQ